MNSILAKIVLGGAGTALLGVGGFVTAIPASAATTPVPAASAQPSDHRSDWRLAGGAIFEAEADALGLTPAQFSDALKAGRSAEDIAKSRGLTQAQVVEKTLATLKPRLDQLVDSKKITRAQADQALELVRSGHLPGWKLNNPEPNHEPNQNPSPSPSPSPSPNSNQNPNPEPRPVTHKPRTPKPTGALI